MSHKYRVITANGKNVADASILTGSSPSGAASKFCTRWFRKHKATSVTVELQRVTGRGVNPAAIRSYKGTRTKYVGKGFEAPWLKNNKKASDRLYKPEFVVKVKALKSKVRQA